MLGKGLVPLCMQEGLSKSHTNLLTCTASRVMMNCDMENQGSRRTPACSVANVCQKKVADSLCVKRMDGRIVLTVFFLVVIKTSYCMADKKGA